MTRIVVFSGYVRAHQASLRIPVTLYNTGARPLIVADLRLGMTSAGIVDLVPTKQFRKRLVPQPDDFDDFPHPYVVPGRSVVTKFVDFAASPRVMASGEPAEIEVHVLIEGRGWRRVAVQEVRTDTMAEPGHYISYSNDPAHWKAGQLERAARALSAVRAEINP